MAMSREAPSLVKLCVGTVIANLRYVGDVSGVDLHLLKDILPHCTMDQLICIENSTQDVDLSPVTNDLWKRFYEQQFGEENMMLVVKRMKQKRVVFKWKKLYEVELLGYSLEEKVTGGGSLSWAVLYGQHVEEKVRMTVEIFFGLFFVDKWIQEDLYL
ncbi:hypothetical protein MA16_Dca010467 [Dendrobium catenatum]|uniref:Uncharacterized protein n=1 Tax=Dendrobium catenatum TaxID=906689 RepID=A0A2I0XBK3_9ASPA|nr:hypothetical protein MA16_Dca010467 [Dendrobium catenatum]